MDGCQEEGKRAECGKGIQMGEALAGFPLWNWAIVFLGRACLGVEKLKIWGQIKVSWLVGGKERKKQGEKVRDYRVSPGRKRGNSRRRGNEMLPYMSL